MESIYKEKDNELGKLDYEKYDEYLNSTIFQVRKICSDKNDYKTTFKLLYRFMKQGFEKKEVRTHPLKYTYSDSADEPVQEMQIRHFIVNLIMWSAFMKYDKVEDICSNTTLDCTNPTKSALYGFINKKIIKPYRGKISTKKMNKALDYIIFRLAGIHNDFGLIMGLTIDAETFIELADEFPEFKDLLMTKMDPHMQTKEIEDTIQQKLKRYLDIVINQNTSNNLRPFLVSGVGINKGQLSQLSINGGLKPDIEGNVNPIPINSNYIWGGLDSITNFYIDGQAGCKPLILNKTVMGKSGYFAYKAMTLSSNYRLSRTVHDCHSQRPIMFHVKTEEHLIKIDGRYYVDALGELRHIDADEDKHLIGQVIALRDPVTCCAPDGICPICYGDQSLVNNDPDFNIGAYAATTISDPVGQKILSSKHMLTTSSTMIVFTDEIFNKFMSLQKTRIFIKQEEETMKDWRIVIDEEDLFIVDELIGPEDFNYYIERFYLYNSKTEEYREISEQNSRDLYLFGSVAQLLKKKIDGKFYIKFSDLDENEGFAAINIENNELTTPLKNIIKLLDRKNHFNCVTIDDMVNKITDLTILAGIDSASTHCSLIIKGLIRQNEDILLAPDFSVKKDDYDYQILTLSNALIYNPSLTVSMSFDNIGKQFISPATYRKYKKSDYDIFYKEEIYEDSLEYYAKIKKEKKVKKLKKVLAYYKKKNKKTDN